MSKAECGDKIDLFEYDLEEMSAEGLQGLLGVIQGCTDCDGCAGEIERLERLLAEKMAPIQPRLF